MASSHEATVDVLTAEVRALMVGSRQVTLSVYRQLDEIDMFDVGGIREAFEPFGRVRTGTKYLDEDRGGREVKREAYREFVGRRRDDGTLARLVVCSADLRLLDAEDKATLAEWERLPLIVLAGLR